MKGKIPIINTIQQLYNAGNMNKYIGLVRRK